MKYPTISDNPHVQTFYVKCRKEGTSHSRAEVFALRQFPAMNTDATMFTEGWKDQFDGSEYGKKARQVAEKAGVSTVGKKYFHSLAQKPMDPRAWVSTRGEIKQRCIETGMECEGNVKVKGCDFGAHPREKYEIHPDVVRGLVKQRLDENPGLKPTKKVIERLTEEVKEKHTPNWVK